MTQDGTEKGLKRKQQLTVECLAAGKSISSTSEEVGVARSTIYRWLKDDYEFKAALNGVKRRLRSEADLRITCLLENAINTVGSAIEGGDARTALSILKGAGLLSGEAPGIGSEDSNALRQQARVREKERKAELDRRELLAGFP